MILGLRNIVLIAILLFYSFSLFSEPIEAKIAEIQILDKITAKVKTYEILDNDNLRVGSLLIEIFACFTNPPEEIPEDYVLLRIYDYTTLEDYLLVYQGWMISSSPSSTPFEHPIYDLWLKDCKMESDF